MSKTPEISFGVQTFILMPPDSANTSTGTEMRVVGGKRKRDADNYLFIDQGVYEITLSPPQEYARDPSAIQAYFSLWLNNSKHPAVKVAVADPLTDEKRIKLTVPYDGSWLKLYVTLRSSDVGKTFAVPVTINRWPLGDEIDSAFNIDLS